MSNKQPFPTKTLKNFTNKSLPFDIEAEAAVLSAIMLDENNLDKVSELLTFEDFYREKHQILYKELYQFTEKQVPFDLIVLHDTLLSKGLLEKAGGVEYLVQLQENLPSIGLLEQHSKIIKEKSLLRSLIIGCSEVISMSTGGQGKSLSEIVDFSERIVFQISNRNVPKEFSHLGELLKKTFKKLSNISENKGEITGITTGFSQLDNMTSGLQSGDLLILAARPSMGKTGLAVNIAVNACKTAKSVGIFSLEMPSEQLVMRMISSESGIPHHRIRTGNISSEEWIELTEIAAALEEAQIFIDDTGGLSMMELRTKARRLKLKHKVDLLVVDYMQLLSIDHKTENRTQEIALISRSLKSLAKELDIPIIACSQLSRSLESRMDKRPMLSDLRESGSIEQDADVVLFIYRDVVYNKDTDNPHQAEIIIGKQRNGPTGIVSVNFEGETIHFSDQDHE